MEELMKKYDLSIKEMMLLASIESLTWQEIEDIEYVEYRIIIYKENR